MNPPTPQIDLDLGPIIYFYTHSLLIIALSAVVFMALGVWIGWLTWARFKRRARAYQEECDLLRHEIAALKRRIGEETVGPAPLVLINEDAPVPVVVDPGPALPGFETLGGGEVNPIAAVSRSMVTEIASTMVTPDIAEPHKESLAAAVLGSKGAAHHTHVPVAPPDTIAEFSPSAEVAEPVPATNGKHSAAAPATLEQNVHAVPEPFPAAPSQTEALPRDASTAFADELASGLAISDARLGILLRFQPDRWDDLTLLRGVGEVLQQRLHDCGVHTFKQIAYWTEDNVNEFSTKIEARDRIRREHWVNQARDMHFLKYGEKLV